MDYLQASFTTTRTDVRNRYSISPLRVDWNPTSVRIMVTDGAGFAGSTRCLKLKERYPAYQIVAFDNLMRRGSELNMNEFKANGIAFIHGDIRNSEVLVDLADLQIHQTEKFAGKVCHAGGSLPNSASLLELTGICQSITGHQVNIGAEPTNRPADL
jgi:UDP-glucose 4-epimerase